MTGPADRVLAAEALLKEPSSNLQSRHHISHTATISSVLRRLSRRGALALLFGTAAVVAVEQRVVFAVEASSSEGVAAAPASDEGGDPAATDAVVTDAPATEPAAASATTPATTATAGDAPATTTSTAAATTSTTASAATTAPVTAKTYAVQAGDTMYSIARKHGVSVDAVL